MRAQRPLLTLLAVLVAVPAFAQTQATGVATVSSTLQVSATVVKAIRLTLSTGTQCAIAAGAGPPDYTMNFGTVDALAITTVTCGAKFQPTTPGITPAVYYSDYKLKPVFTSQAATTNTITAYVSTNFAVTAAGLLTIVQSGTISTAPTVIADLTAMSTAVGAQTLVATNAANAVEITRHIGVSVAAMNGAGVLTGADSARITYTIIVS